MENETRKHILEVVKYLNIFSCELLKRATLHDKSKLEEWGKLISNLVIFYNIEFPESSDNFDYYKGVLSIDSILNHVIDIFKAIFYISGPPSMLFSFKGELKERGISSEKIKIDAWE